MEVQRSRCIEGTAVLMRENLFNSGKFWASVADRFAELFGDHVTVQFVSSTCIDPSRGRGEVGKSVKLKKWLSPSKLKTGKCRLPFLLEWDVDRQGIPGAIIVKNDHVFEFFLETITINGVPGKGEMHFVCNSWVYPKLERIFFATDTYIPNQTPAALQPYRTEELDSLRRNADGPLKEKDRIYDYALYNDLGNPDDCDYYARPVLGGSSEKPYPRRGLTGRPPTDRDPNSESRQSSVDKIYVPHDERFGYHKRSALEAYKIKSLTHRVFQIFCDLISPREFLSFKDIHKLYKSGPESREIEGLTSTMRIKFFMELGRKEGSHTFCFPEPQLIKENKDLWKSDEEFARQMLAGLNPVIISRLEEFPPSSKLDQGKFGNQTSKITPEEIQPSLDGLTVNQALEKSMLFILDHHDRFMPYLREINALEGIHVYATRTVLFLQDDGTLKPVAIELSLPHPDGWIHGAESQVYTPSDRSTWLLAKAYVVVNDSAHHQLISHWLNTHAVMEPFVIATNRQLSAMHPIHKLLKPHFKDTMKINALARQILINAGGIIESTFALRHYALEWSSDAYKSWNFTEQGLPQDLIKRGIAVEDPSRPNKVLRLLIEDYPYAVDGLDVWWAIESWVEEYCSIYYPDNQTVEDDHELQAWWEEIRNTGHGDLKYETWWPAMRTCKELTSTCTTMIWIASALHAAVNFGQYHYGGYYPNRPTVSRRPMPQPGTIYYNELLENPDKVYLKTITCPKEAMEVMATIEILSRHPPDEEYLGQRDENWTCDKRALDAFERFRKRLIEIEKLIYQRNKDRRLKNRTGPAEVPYKLLYPNTSDTTRRGTGIVGMGIPNSVSI